MAAALDDVVIIGAGLAGTALALALHQQGISCRLYESRATNASQISSGVILTPNGLKVLDHLGVLDRIKSRCWTTMYRTFKNDKDETTQKQVVATEELYGYMNHRLWRAILLEEMTKMLKERRVPITYNAKFSGITVDSAGGVTWLLNGRCQNASMLIGADGIHSSVRKHLAPGVEAEYTGTMGVLSHIPTNSVKWPYQDFEIQCTIQGKPGAIFMIPEDKEGSEIMIGKQAKYPDQSRSEWDQMNEDKERLCDFYREGYDQWNDTTKSIIDSVCAHKETLYLWPFMRMPHLERWFSKSGRVIIVGDAAHALPPSSGQGVNQGLEDVYSLTLILKNTRNDITKALESWQNKRQTRIDQIFDYATNSTNVSRMAEAEREQLINEGKVKNVNDPDGDMRWLYLPDLDQFAAA